MATYSSYKGRPVSQQMKNKMCQVLTKDKNKAIKSEGILSFFNKEIMILWSKILVACIPAAVIGILFDEVFEKLFYKKSG